MSQQGWWVYIYSSNMSFRAWPSIWCSQFCWHLFSCLFPRPVAHFFSSIRGCLVIYSCSIFLPITVVTQQYFFDQYHHLHFLNLFNRPANLFSVGLFTAAVTFSFGLVCSHTNLMAFNFFM